MYRLSESQAPAYDRMPQINTFMSAILQAVKPSANTHAHTHANAHANTHAHAERHSKDASDTSSPPPADRWQLAERLTEGAYQTGGMLARSANYLNYLADYQTRLLADLDSDDQRLPSALEELRLIGRFCQQLSHHQAEMAGRAMAAAVAVRRQVWMAKTSYSDTLKATVADLPFVVTQSQGSGVTAGGMISATTDALYKQEQ